MLGRRCGSNHLVRVRVFLAVWVNICICNIAFLTLFRVKFVDKVVTQKKKKFFDEEFIFQRYDILINYFL